MTDTPMPPHPEVEPFHALPLEALIERYRSGTASLNATVLRLGDEQADQCFLPDADAGRWSCRMLLGHLADAEMICGFRMRKLVAEPGSEMAMWDQDAFVDAGLYSGPGQPMAGFVAVVHTTRLWLSEWLGGLPEAAWACRGLHLRRGEMTLRQLVAFTAWHLEHHAWYLDRKLARLALTSSE
ncbi:MAG: DinB family protein [Phycisphaerales bacterium]|nr:DinB family protein [Phycisphaerales bacterium]